jgi:hypothetical protein
LLCSTQVHNRYCWWARAPVRFKGSW